MGEVNQASRRQVGFVISFSFSFWECCLLLRCAPTVRVRKAAHGHHLTSSPTPRAQQPQQRHCTHPAHENTRTPTHPPTDALSTSPTRLPTPTQGTRRRFEWDGKAQYWCPPLLFFSPSSKCLQRFSGICDLVLHSLHSRRSTTFLVVLALLWNTGLVWPP